MKKNIKTLFIVAILIILPLLFYLISPIFTNNTVNDPLPTFTYPDKNDSPDIITMNAVFTDADSNHKTSGTISLIESENERYLRFENFKVTNGPDLFVYASKDLDAKEFINIGELKGNIGNQNYELDSSVSLEEYPYVLIWCKQFGVLFGSAEF